LFASSHKRIATLGKVPRAGGSTVQILSIKASISTLPPNSWSPIRTMLSSQPKAHKTSPIVASPARATLCSPQLISTTDLTPVRACARSRSTSAAKSSHRCPSNKLTSSSASISSRRATPPHVAPSLTRTGKSPEGTSTTSVRVLSAGTFTKSDTESQASISRELHIATIPSFEHSSSSICNWSFFGRLPPCSVTMRHCSVLQSGAPAPCCKRDTFSFALLRKQRTT